MEFLAQRGSFPSFYRNTTSLLRSIFENTHPIHNHVLPLSLHEEKNDYILLLFIVSDMLKFFFFCFFGGRMVSKAKRLQEHNPAQQLTQRSSFG